MVKAKRIETSAKRKPRLGKKAPGRAAKRASAPSTADRAVKADEIIAKLRADGISNAKIGGFDIDGVLRGKYVSLDKLHSAIKKGFGFCDVIFGWDIVDALYDASKLTGWHTGYPDVQALLDPDSLRPIPWEPGVVAMLCDFRDSHGAPHPACPRSLLKRVRDRAAKHGFVPKFSVEFEFFVFQETRDTLKDKDFRALTPLDPGMFGYSWLRTGQDAALMRELLAATSAFGIELEGLHTETGPGVYEAAIAYDDVLAAADKAALFKSTVKQVAHRHGLSATFMAKWNADYPGCSGHIHQSLWREGKNAFYDGKHARGMSSTMQHYLGGQLQLMQEFTALMSPTINSYKRYVPGLWAPLVASWGVENRTCALRVIGLSDPMAARVEHRQGAADLNPYIAMAAALGAGLLGIERRIKLPPETQGDPGDEGLRLPRTLTEATDRLEKSQSARELFGDEFVDHYVMTRRWEVQAFNRAVTDWELRRYFESI